jgi:hypothetical protein
MLLTLAAFAPAQEVEHAPTLESCAADVNLWTSQIPGWPNPSAEQLRQGTKDVTVQRLRGRTVSLFDCSSAYPALIRNPAPGTVSASFSLVTLYYIEIEERYRNFLDRHDLLVKFKQEDEAGKR